MAGIRVFWMEATEFASVRLRRYRYADAKCSTGSGCDADVVIHDQAPFLDWMQPSPTSEGCWQDIPGKVAPDDPRWPRACEACGADLQDAVQQIWADRLYSGAPDGLLYAVRDFPVGAMWSEAHLEDNAGFVGPDGLSLHVRTPGGIWCVDSQCSNCTRNQSVPVDGEPGWTRFVRSHYCWPRRGDPRTGHVDVRKEHGETCSAGAGSVICNGWHGFLHDDFLVT